MLAGTVQKTDTLSKHSAVEEINKTGRENPSEASENRLSHLD